MPLCLISNPVHVLFSSIVPFRFIISFPLQKGLRDAEMGVQPHASWVLSLTFHPHIPKLGECSSDPRPGLARVPFLQIGLILP